MLTGNASDKTPSPSEITIQAWTQYFAGRPTWTPADLVAAVDKYCSLPRERLVQPADLGQIITSSMRDRLDRADPDARPAMTQAALQPGVRLDKFGHIDKASVDLDRDEPYPLEWTTAQRASATWTRIQRFRDGQVPQFAYERASGAGVPASDETRASAVADFVRHRTKSDADGVVEDVPQVKPRSVACPFCRAQADDPCTMPAMSGAKYSKPDSKAMRSAKPLQLPREKLTSIVAHPSRIAAAAVAAGFGDDEDTKRIKAGLFDELSPVVQVIVAAAQRQHALRVTSRWTSGAEPSTNPVNAAAASSGAVEANLMEEPK